MKWRKNGITIDHHERPKYETSGLYCNAILVTEGVAAGAQSNGGTTHRPPPPPLQKRGYSLKTQTHGNKFGVEEK
jgi:hypothetical protein